MALCGASFELCLRQFIAANPGAKREKYPPKKTRYATLLQNLGRFLNLEVCLLLGLGSASGHSPWLALEYYHLI